MSHGGPRRRTVLGLAAALAGGALAGCAGRPAIPVRTRVVVVGGGYGGATAAKYLRLYSEGRIEVVLVEPDETFVSCPMSNLVVHGSRTLADISRPYGTLERVHGVRRVRDRVTAIDVERRVARLAAGDDLRWDKLVLAPGVEMMWDSVEGLQAANRAGRIVQAWSPGEETMVLRRQLVAMRDGGVYAIAIPEIPYRCPPGPYERACLVADYFKRAKPRSKVLVLDANEDVTSKGPLFKRAWAERYAGIVEYRPQYKATGVDAAAGIVRFEVQDDVKADVLNVLPDMRAGRVAVAAGLANSNQRWCNVDWLNFESTAARHVHVLGDALQIAPLMPKSGHMANSHAKAAAAAIVAELAGWEPDPHPMLANTCYSFVDPDEAVHIASVHEYVAADRTYKPVAGSGGLSSAPSAAEGRIAWGWAHAIWDDMLG
ncbi:MAG: FAD-dependent oxidoreductase [Proteobacteria bacterium]|nr:FAD-dependent oxidoreductase [Pseudomonadota bacterium]